MNSLKFIREQRARLLEGIGVPEMGNFKVDPFQKEAIDSVVSGSDTLVVAPTGSGKTYIATEAISAFLAMGTRAIYTTPLKALSNTKYAEFGKLFSGVTKVGILTGDRKIDTEAGVVVATTEIYRNELYRTQDKFGLVVLDEVHFIADEQRGPVWEESIILTPKDASLLMLSASISNPEEISEWIASVRGKPCRILQAYNRPVELRFGFMHPEYGIIPLRDPNGRLLQEVRQFYGSSTVQSHGRGRSPQRNRKRDPRGGRQKSQKRR